MKFLRKNHINKLFHCFQRSSLKRFHSIQRKEGWESVIGLEVHAQISAASKLFSPSGSKFGDPVNTSVSLFDAAIPGTLPVLNKRCVEAAVLTAMSLSCSINPVSWFDRKHYFYADSPAGYQITQQRKAIANDGHLEFVVYSPGVHKQPYYQRSSIKQLQLEQDSGKSLHIPSTDRSLIDLNRAGIALMEIVFEPDLKDGEEAGALVKELVLILQRIETCNCKMEEGSLRVDANISVNKKGASLGTRTEVKNLSSIRSLVNAIEYEVHRQILSLERGERIINETRSYDAFVKETVPMRDKEVLQDYRFMPEPNLPPLKLNCDPSAVSEDSAEVNIFRVGRNMKELPETTRANLIKNYGLKLETAWMIVNTPGFLECFNSIMADRNSKLGIKVANFMSTEVLGELNERNLTFYECPVPESKLGDVIDLLEANTINLNKGKDLLNLLFGGDPRSPQQIVVEEDWGLVQDDDDILKVCEQVLEENSKLVLEFKAKGKSKHLNQLIGKVRTKTSGKLDMKKVSQTIEEILKR